MLKQDHQLSREQTRLPLAVRHTRGTWPGTHCLGEWWGAWNRTPTPHNLITQKLSLLAYPSTQNP